MKTLFLAAAAAVSLAGVAFAQQPTSPDQSTTAGQQGSMPSNGATQSTMQSGGQGSPSAPGPNTTAGSMPSSSMPSGSMPSSNMSSTSGAMPASSMPMASGGMTANTPAGDAPGEYPVCTKRGQDRCKSTGRRGK